MPTIKVQPSSATELQQIADIMAKSRKVVVVTGAGISTNCGIPDFRSENGLYSMIQAQYDAALRDPPWESSTNDVEIDDRPKKKRRVTDRWYYELVRADGSKVEVASDEPAEQASKESSLQPESPASRCSSPGRSRSRSHTPVENTTLDDEQPELESEDSSIGEKPSQQLLQESNEYANQYSSEVSQVLEDNNAQDDSAKDDMVHNQNVPHSPQPKTFSVVIPEKYCDWAANKPSTERRSSSPSPQKSTSDQSLPAKAQSAPCSRSSSRDLIDQPSIEDSKPDVLSESRPPSRQSTDLRLGDPVLQESKPFSRRSSRRIGPKSREDNIKSMPSNITIESASSAGSSTVGGSSSDCNSRRNLSSESSSITTASECDEPASQSSTARALPNLKGKDLFDSVIWSDPFSTSIFYMFISSFRRKIYDEVKSTTHTHKFIRTLRDNGRLVRNYTQNIDCLEEREGLSTDLELGAGDRTRFQKVQSRSLPNGNERDTSVASGVECVLLHGSLRMLRCGVCSKLSSWDEADRESTTMAGSAPDCPACVSSSLSRQDKGRRGLAVGRLRPDIVLYGEDHPNANLVGPIVVHDLKLGPDVLLILGTSLRVFGLKRMVREFAQAVHAKGGSVIFVNQTKPPESTWGEFIDYWVEWDCDAWVLDLKTRRGDIWLPPGSGQEIKPEKTAFRYRQPGDSESRPKYRPQALRDDKLNGVHFTFRILDSLGKVQDGEGKESSRPQYWQSFDRKPYRASTGQIRDFNPKSRVSQVSSKNSRKSLPQRPKRKAPPSKTSTKKNRVKTETLDGTAPDSIQPADKVTFAFWQELRKLSNYTLSEKTFEDIRKRMPPLSELSANIPGNLPGYKRSFDEIKVLGGLSGNGFPTLKGLHLEGMGLASLPPSGAPELKGKGKGVDRGGTGCRSESVSNATAQSALVVNVTKPVPNHAYGTRSKRGAPSHDTITCTPMTGDKMRIDAVCNDR
ncbi:hst3 protein [Rutstroemia sp. NJR-2017a BBW]|nr:hst3 protein [Rutstroemia sp. NJR-2017a BBW]